MKKKHSKRFNKIVGIFTIIGTIATICGLYQAFCQNTDTQKITYNNRSIYQQNTEGDINQYNVEGDVNQYDIESDLVIVTHYNSLNEDVSLGDSKNLLYQRLKDNVDDKILCFIPGDFDNDGKEEAFAFVGHRDDTFFEGSEELWEGIPYFISEKTIQKLFTNTRSGSFVDSDLYCSCFKEIKFGENKAIAFSLYYTTGSTDEIYGVKNGEPIHYQIL